MKEQIKAIVEKWWQTSDEADVAEKINKGLKVAGIEVVIDEFDVMDSDSIDELVLVIWYRI